MPRGLITRLIIAFVLAILCFCGSTIYTQSITREIDDVAGIQFFTYADYIHNNYDQNLFYSLSIQSVPLLDEKLVVSIDAAFDGYALNPGFAVGASYEFIRDISILAEYYPLVKVDPKNDCVGTTGVYSFGLKIQTSGHQFIFKFGNSTDIGMRRLMLGTDSLDIYAGFSIMRLIRF
jgi:hypothetical protein